MALVRTHCPDEQLLDRGALLEVDRLALEDELVVLHVGEQERDAKSLQGSLAFEVLDVDTAEIVIYSCGQSFGLVVILLLRLLLSVEILYTVTRSLPRKMAAGAGWWQRLGACVSYNSCWRCWM